MRYSGSYLLEGTVSVHDLIGFYLEIHAVERLGHLKNLGSGSISSHSRMVGDQIAGTRKVGQLNLQSQGHLSSQKLLPFESHRKKVEQNSSSAISSRETFKVVNEENPKCSLQVATLLDLLRVAQREVT